MRDIFLERSAEVLHSCSRSSRHVSPRMFNRKSRIGRCEGKREAPATPFPSSLPPPLRTSIRGDEREETKARFLPLATPSQEGGVNERPCEQTRERSPTCARSERWQAPRSTRKHHSSRGAVGRLTSAGGERRCRHQPASLPQSVTRGARCGIEKGRGARKRSTVSSGSRGPPEHARVPGLPGNWPDFTFPRASSVHSALALPGNGDRGLFFGRGCFEAMRSIEIKPGGSLQTVWRASAIA